MTKKIKRYGAGQLIISYDESRCIFARQCENRLPSVFNRSDDPWIEPENADQPELVTQAVEHCPSGALTYKFLAPGSPREKPDREATCRIQPNGPLHFRGDMHLFAEDRSLTGSETRLALCRCGHSKNKPHCDNQCREQGFQDLGQIPVNSRDPRPNFQTHLQIRPIKNGPLEVEGNLTVLDEYSNWQTQEDKTRLCRCGQSRNKPYCDNSHIFHRFRSANPEPDPEDSRD